MTLRQRWLIGFGAVFLGWWSLPNWLPALRNSRSVEAPDVVAVASGDFRRTMTAVALWQERPGALLALTVPAGDSQEMNNQVLRGAHLSSEAWARVRRIPTCGDSVTEIEDLTRWLASLPGPGSLTVLTSPEHLPRLETIARVMAGSLGWQVHGVESLTSEHKPETLWRLVRDVLRAQLWRATGWTGREVVCPARSKGLL